MAMLDHFVMSPCGFCAPVNRDSRPAVPKPLGAGWYQSGRVA
jgi:hypothetical protein